LYDLGAGQVWRPGAVTLFRWLDNAAPYEPNSPWPGVGRFGAGAYKTLYLAGSAKGAMAEYFRRHPEFLDFQEDLDVTLFQLDVQVLCECLDVRVPDQAAAVGFDFRRLLSSEADERVRYEDCRALAKDVVGVGLCGLAYPSAAATGPAWNLVLFGDPGAWAVTGYAPATRPRLDPAEVQPLARLT
jgi:hypothetical protein